MIKISPLAFAFTLSCSFWLLFLTVYLLAEGGGVRVEIGMGDVCEGEGERELKS